MYIHTHFFSLPHLLHHFHTHTHTHVHTHTHTHTHIHTLQPILTDIAAYGETVEKTVAIGDSLKGEGEEGEREKVDRRLEVLSSQFAELQEAANARMNGGGGVHTQSL